MSGRTLLQGMELYEPPAHEFGHWRWDQIYFGPEFYSSIYKGGVVPNIDDIVTKFVGGGKYIEYRCTAKDPVTLIPTLTIITPVASPEESPELGNELLFAGLGKGRVTDTDFLFVNYDNLRYPAEVHHAMRAYGSNTSYYMLFLGTDINRETGTVVSVRYAANGDVEGPQIPMELIDDTNPDRAIFRPASCNVDRVMPDGEIVTLVAYNDTHGLICYQPLLVVNSAAAKDVNPYTNYVTGIHLESPYQSPTDAMQLIIPENFLNTSLIKEAYVDYRDGSKRKITLGTSGMELHGWDTHSGQWAGQEFTIVLTYQLGSDEVAPLSEVGEGGKPHVYATYTVTTKPADPQSSVKLYACPAWVSDAQGYTMRYWLYNLAQTEFVEVTDKVKAGTGGTGPFQPKLYGQNQKLVVTLALNAVNGTYPAIQYMQEFDITLNGRPSKGGTPYYLWYTPGSSRPYGENLEVEVKAVDGKNYLDISCGLSQPYDWLDKLYYRLEPQYLVGTAPQAEEPTLVEIVCKNGAIEVDVSQWDNDIPISFTAPANGETIYLRWKYRDAGGNKKHLATGTITAFTA